MIQMGPCATIAARSWDDSEARTPRVPAFGGVGRDDHRHSRRIHVQNLREEVGTFQGPADIPCTI